jgi:hypothetical protein
MTLETNRVPPATETLCVRKPYEKPKITRVDLALAETLSEGCKLGSDPGCVGPPLTLSEGGS